jgi:hypothetical protein
MTKFSIEKLNEGNILQCLIYTQKFLFLKNKKISISSGILEFCLQANFGTSGVIWFGQNLLHREWLTVCPSEGQNLENPTTCKGISNANAGNGHCKGGLELLREGPAI